MPIFISEEEKTAIQDYFNHPGRYTSDEVVATLSGGLPDGAKVSRAKSSYEKADIPKRYIILAGTDGLSRYIPIVTGLLDDPGTHSATRVSPLSPIEQLGKGRWVNPLMFIISLILVCSRKRSNTQQIVTVIFSI